MPNRKIVIIKRAAISFSHKVADDGSLVGEQVVSVKTFPKAETAELIGDPPARCDPVKMAARTSLLRRKLKRFPCGVGWVLIPLRGPVKAQSGGQSRLRVSGAARCIGSGRQMTSSVSYWLFQP